MAVLVQRLYLHTSAHESRQSSKSFWPSFVLLQYGGKASLEKLKIDLYKVRELVELASCQVLLVVVGS